MPPPVRLNRLAPLHDIPAEAEACMWLGVAHARLGEPDLARSRSLNGLLRWLALVGPPGSSATSLINTAYLEDLSPATASEPWKLLAEARRKPQDQATTAWARAFVDARMAGLLLGPGPE